MSVIMTSAVWKLSMSRTQKLVALALADLGNHQGTGCYPGQRRLATMTGLGLRTVRNALVALEERGLIERQERRRPDGYRTSDSYRLLFAAPDASERLAATCSNFSGNRCRAVIRKGNRKVPATSEELVGRESDQGETVVPFGPIRRRARV